MVNVCYLVKSFKTKLVLIFSICYEVQCFVLLFTGGVYDQISITEIETVVCKSSS